MFEKLRLLAHACVLAGLLSASLTAHAQPSPVYKVALDWRRSAGAEACIESVELERRVEQRLGREVFSHTNDAPVIIAGAVAPATEQGFSANLRVSGPDGTLYGSREVSVLDPDCRKLDDVVALIISVTLRHDGVGGIALPQSIAKQLTRTVEPEPDKPSPAAISSAPSGPSAQLWRLRLEAGFGLTTGLTPSTNFAPLVRAQIELQNRYSLALEGRLALTQTDRVVSEPRGSLIYRSNAIALVACVSPLRAARVALAVCVDGRVGYLSVEPRDFAHSYGASARWLELALAASLRVTLLGPTFAHLRLGVPWRVNRPQFKYESTRGDLRDAFQIALLALDLSLSLGVEF
ncbi:MAG TPA: hypothetical protein VFN67_41690 [Polyangiales bacterium]|nr:hypothetical protein [Polyangiales bacterium]